MTGLELAGAKRVDLPRTSVEVIDELRALLHVAEVPAPYLTGRSFPRRPLRTSLRAAVPRRGFRPGSARPCTRGLQRLHAPGTGRPVGGLGPR